MLKLSPHHLGEQEHKPSLPLPLPWEEDEDFVDSTETICSGCTVPGVRSVAEGLSHQ